MAFLVQHGFGYADILEMDPILRTGYAYIIQKQSGGTVDWTSGQVRFD